MIYREGLDWEEFKENVEAIKQSLRSNLITLEDARKRLARLGFNATDTEQELKDVDT